MTVPPVARNSATRAVAIATSYLLAVAVLTFLGKLPPLVLALYLVLSLLTVGIYALDKLRAAKEWRRTPEQTLHVLALLGGWPGALVAQQWLRHKTFKHPFRLVFWLTVAANVALAGYLLTGYGAWLKSFMQVAGKALHSLFTSLLPG